MTYLPVIAGQQIKEYQHVSESEAMAIWTAARTPRILCFVKTLWFTGLRISEVLRLKVSDLRISGNDYSLSILRSKKRHAQPELLPVSRELGESLKLYTTGMKPATLLFPGHENTYRYEIRICAKRAGLENWQKIHPHSFRHGFVYHRAQAGVHPYVLSKTCGHSSLGITLTYYQPTERDIRAAMEL